MSRMDAGWVRYFFACTALLMLLSLSAAALWMMRQRILGDAASPATTGDGAGRNFEQEDRDQINCQDAVHLEQIQPASTLPLSRKSSKPKS